MAAASMEGMDEVTAAAGDAVIEIDDAACGAMMLEALNGLLARGMTARQILDSLFGSAVGLALRSGWTGADIERVTREYVEILSKMTQATTAGQG